MSKKDSTFIAFLNEIMRLRKCLPNKLAAELGVSHATVSRWLSGSDIPSISSCRKLAEYSGVPLEKILATTNYLPPIAVDKPMEWPEFREYAQRKYPDELDEDLISMIEDLIERRRAKKYAGKNKQVGI